MGKFTISMVMFYSYLYVYQAGYEIDGLPIKNGDFL